MKAPARCSPCWLPLPSASACRRAHPFCSRRSRSRSPRGTYADEPYIEYAPGVVLVKVRRRGVAEWRQRRLGRSHGGGGGRRTHAGRLAAGLWRNRRRATLWRAAGERRGPARDDLPRDPALLDADVPMAAQAMATDAAVAWAEPDYIARPAAPLSLDPNDPELGAQWALARIGAPAAWELSTGSPGVIIAIIDSGVDMAHEEFAGAAVGQPRPARRRRQRPQRLMWMM